MGQRIAQVRSNQCIVYHKGNGGAKHDLTDAQKEGLKKGTAGNYNGEMSSETKRMIKKLLDTWTTQVISMKKMFIEKYKESRINLTFVTLTLPSKQIHTDNEIKRECLDKFIQICSKKYYFFEYFWRAEKQKNGNVHFHIITNYYMNHQWIMATWNKCIEKLGYVSAYSLKMKKLSWEKYYAQYGKYSKKPLDKIKSYYAEQRRTGWKQPNSTDIHAIGKIKNITAYVMKYVTKSASDAKGYEKLSEEEKNKLKVDGRIWGCSDSIRKLKHYELVLWDKDRNSKEPIWDNRIKYEEIVDEMTVTSYKKYDWFEIMDFEESLTEKIMKNDCQRIKFVKQHHLREITNRYFPATEQSRKDWQNVTTEFPTHLFQKGR
jgi:hypothetical protein